MRMLGPVAVRVMSVPPGRDYRARHTARIGCHFDVAARGIRSHRGRVGGVIARVRRQSYRG